MAVHGITGGNTTLTLEREGELRLIPKTLNQNNINNTEQTASLSILFYELQVNVKNKAWKTLSGFKSGRAVAKVAHIVATHSCQ